MNNIKKFLVLIPMKDPSKSKSRLNKVLFAEARRRRKIGATITEREAHMLLIADKRASRTNESVKRERAKARFKKENDDIDFLSAEIDA